MTAPEPVEANVYRMTLEERREKNIGSLPGNLNEALDCLEADPVICDALGGHLLEFFLREKRKEWLEYIAQVHEWEVDRYLSIL
jgi:glutamine synthetase